MSAIETGDSVRYFDAQAVGGPAWVRGIVRKKGTVKDVTHNEGLQDGVAEMRAKYVAKTGYKVLPYGCPDNEENFVTVLDTGRNIYPYIQQINHF